MIRMLILILIGTVFAAALLAVFLIAPYQGGRRAKKWRGTLFAHRGLHGNGVAENTLPAFERACAHGFGIELDVRLSKDGEVVVFHDDDFNRLLGDGRRVDEMEMPALRCVKLPNEGYIPTFQETLDLVGGRVPLLVEVKNGARNEELCRKTLALLRSYHGAYIVESFSPPILFWFRRHARDVLRGQLVTEEKEYAAQFSPFVAFMLSNLLLNFLARPDFVAYKTPVKDFYAPRIQRKLFHTPMAAWTVRTPEKLSEVRARNEMAIFERFLPESGSIKESGGTCNEV